MTDSPTRTVDDALCITCGKIGGVCRWVDDPTICMREQINRLRSDNALLARAALEATALRVWFGATERHPEPQWFMRAVDLRTGKERDFAMRDMSEVAWEAKS